MKKKKSDGVKHNKAVKCYDREVVLNTIRDVRGSLLASSECDDYLRGVLDACNTVLEALD